MIIVIDMPEDAVLLFSCVYGIWQCHPVIHLLHDDYKQCHLDIGSFLNEQFQFQLLSFK